MTQKFKSIYFKTTQNQGETITVSFSESENKLFENVSKLSSIEIRNAIGINNYELLLKSAKKKNVSLAKYIKNKICKKFSQKEISIKDVTYINNKKQPFSRWYPYIEGYSSGFIKSLLSIYNLNPKLIYDPFSGTGTTVFVCGQNNINSIYSEINPLLIFLTETKNRVLLMNDSDRYILSEILFKKSREIKQVLFNSKKDESLRSSYLHIFNNSSYFENEVFENILKLRFWIDEQKAENDLLGDLLLVAVISILIPISKLKKSGDVRFKTKKEMIKERIELLPSLINIISIIATDVKNTEYKLFSNPKLILCNSKNLDSISSPLQIDTVITSPPYLNGTNYLRNTKLELWFLKKIFSNNDLRLLRDEIVTSGINDVSKNKNIDIDIDISKYSPTLASTLGKLIKSTYDKRIPTMCEHYFLEMYIVFRGLKNHLKNKANILIDIGDSIFAGTHIRTDKILTEILEKLGYDFVSEKLLRKRRSRDKTLLSQTLLVFKYSKEKIINTNNIAIYDKKKWSNFKKLPYQKQPYSKRNWGQANHSLCSYQGKLKASIAHHLVLTFAPKDGLILDPFCGVGTIPYEASLNGIKSYGMDISKLAYIISSAKIALANIKECNRILIELDNYIKKTTLKNKVIDEMKNFGFNKKIYDYYHKDTLAEILLARSFFIESNIKTPESFVVFSSLLHILHGNRPYALSRRSHPIIPYAPQGEFIYKNLIEKLREKVTRTIKNYEDINRKTYVEGKIFLQDSTHMWPPEVNNLDAVITSPPFFDSTRFYLANWIRLWFTGWNNIDFKNKPSLFIEEKQKDDFIVYENIFRQSRERLKKGGVMVMHLGKSSKCDMAEKLISISKKWFKVEDVFDENVSHCESHGVRDKGTVTSHQYLVLK